VFPRLISLSFLENGEYFHVPPETWGTARQVVAEFGVSGRDWAFSHALQVGIGRTTDALRIREGFREIRLGETEEFFFLMIKFVLLSLPHCSCPSRNLGIGPQLLD
jgi:hypothetical protein